MTESRTGLVLKGGFSLGFAMDQPSLFPDLVAHIAGLVFEMLARRAEGGGVADGNEFDDVANAAAAIEEITAVLFHDKPPIE